jgi:rhamnopyranosyl-N-acetylglucosaminyl-diphospho-decaprenol beta-1,3/1,4-galactofuranosyltransferase
MEKVIAVVVSHNRHHLLVDCIQSLRNQTRKPDEILVVNNGSSDYTSVWLDKQEDLVHLYQDNLGSAGGFHTGIKWAYEKGYQWIWCMDDDGYAKEDALEVLLNQNEKQPVLLNCAVLNKEDKRSFVWKTGNFSFIDEVKQDIINGIGHPFNGSLINRNIVTLVGLPNANLYHRGEEVEYFYRITKTFKIDAKTVIGSVYFHPPAKYSYTKEWNLKESWSTYFHARNQYSIMKSKYNNAMKACFAYAGFVVSFVYNVLATQKNDRLKKLNFIFNAAVDGITNDSSQNSETVKASIHSLYQNNFYQKLVNPFKKYLLNLFVPSYTETTNHVTV